MFCLLENIPMCYGLSKEEHENIVCCFVFDACVRV